MDLRPAGNSHKKLITVFALLLAIVVIVGGISVFNKGQADSMVVANHSSDTSVSQTVNVATNQPMTSTTASPTSSRYKDGSYSAVDSYNSPGGREAITVTVAVIQDTVTSTSIQQDADNRTSSKYQSTFKSNYSSQVVGKKLSDVQLSRVSGSSLTSGGFNAALEQIKLQATQTQPSQNH